MTVYFDGSCPLCQAEIGYYRRKDQAGALCLADISKTSAVTPEGITRQRAMERFAVRASDRRVQRFLEDWRATLRMLSAWLAQLALEQLICDR